MMVEAKQKRWTDCAISGVCFGSDRLRPFSVRKTNLLLLLPIDNPVIAREGSKCE